MRKINLLILTSFFILGLFVNNIEAKQANTSSIIKKINITGNNKYNSEFYKKIININTNSIYNKTLKDKLINNLYKSDLVKNVDVSFKNNNLNINIEENPIIKNIKFVGNRKFKENYIKSLNLKLKDSFSQTKLNHDLEAIKGFYNSVGLYNTKVDYEIIELENNFVEIIFKIKEGSKARINRIEFIGNNKIKSKTLKEEIYSKENKFYRFGRKITYNPDMKEYNMVKVQEYYFSKGYIGLNIISYDEKYNEENNTFDIIFKINEGGQFTINKINIKSSIENISEKDIRNLIKDIKEDDIFNIKKLRSVKNDVSNGLFDKNYKTVKINLQIIPIDNENKIDININIDKEKYLYIRSIKIRGNNKTTDTTIRNELKIEEGSVLSDIEIQRSLQKIKGLGFLKNANYEVIDTGIDDQVDILINIDEGNFGSIGFGIGYSDLNGVFGTINIEQKNLFGKGIHVGFDVGVYEYTKNFSILFAKPNIFNTKITGGIELSYSDSNNTKNSKLNIDYDEKTYSMSIFAKYSLTEYLNQKWAYSYSFERISNLDPDYKNIFSENDQKISEISTEFSYDKRDSSYDPTNGYLLNLNFGYAGLGGTIDYLKTVANFIYYHPIFTKDIILKFETKVGHIESLDDNNFYPDDGFYLGGYSMKGFENRGLGPRLITRSLKQLIDESDKDFKRRQLRDGYSLSGTDIYYANMELKFPMFTPREFNMYTILFINAGTVKGIVKNKNVKTDLITDDGKIRSAYGVTLLWKTPIGNITFDFSRTLKQEFYDNDQSFSFNIGRSF